MEQNKWLISVALNRRHLTEGQKAVLANNYSTILSEKLSSDAGKKAINARWHPDKEYDEATVASTYEDEVARWQLSKEYSSETVSEQHNENGKFLSVVATVASSDKMKLIGPARRLLTNLTGQYLGGHSSLRDKLRVKPFSDIVSEIGNDERGSSTHSKNISNY